MKITRYLSVVVLAIGLTAGSPVQAQLLGGVLGGGDSDGGGGGIDLDVSDGSVGISGVATVSAGSSSGGTNAGVTLLGGGGRDVDVPLNNVLGGSSGANVDLPGLGGGGGLPGLPGISGQPGAPGVPGAPGQPGGVYAYYSTGGGGTGGGGGYVGGSSRLQLLMAVMQNRAWTRFAQGNRLCLPPFGVANASRYVKRTEQAQLQQMLNAYGNDIRVLQQMLLRCRNGQNRMIDVSRVIGVDMRPNGQLVVFTI